MATGYNPYRDAGGRFASKSGGRAAGRRTSTAANRGTSNRAAPARNPDAGGRAPGGNPREGVSTKANPGTSNRAAPARNPDAGGRAPGGNPGGSDRPAAFRGVPSKRDSFRGGRRRR